MEWKLGNLLKEVRLKNKKQLVRCGGALCWVAKAIGLLVRCTRLFSREMFEKWISIPLMTGFMLLLVEQMFVNSTYQLLAFANWVSFCNKQKRYLGHASLEKYAQYFNAVDDWISSYLGSNDFEFKLSSLRSWL